MSENIQKEAIKSGVFDIINETLRIPREKILQNSRLFNDLNAESIDLLDIRFELERTFNLNISDTEITESIGKDLPREKVYEKLTVASIIEFIEKKLNS